MERIYLVLILLSPILCFAESIDCGKLHKSALEKGRSGSTYEGKVIGKGRAYLHKAPEEQCRTKEIFLVPGDYISIYAESNDWLYLMYINKNGDDFSGWIPESRIKVIDPYGK